MLRARKHNRAWRVVLDAGFLRVCPIQPHFLQWAQGHLNWNNVRWQNVLFSDESRFCIDHADGRVRVWRRRGDRYADNCVVENNAWGGPSLMLWGAIGHNQVLGPVIFQGLGPGRGNGITAQRYMDQVLHPHVLPFFRHTGTGFSSTTTRAPTLPGLPRTSCSARASK
nr:hypothetical protein BaRGS_026674 [Batillaria attramentaria]